MTTTIQESAAPARAVQPQASVPVSGLVDPADGHALVRVSGYRFSPADVYVSAGQIKQYGLRKGDWIEGSARPSAGGRAKYRPLVTVDTVNPKFPPSRLVNVFYQVVEPLITQIT
jgi:transcription termination factor Rho